MTPAQLFIDHLHAATREAEAAETAFRRDFATRLAALEADRAVAYRRMNLAQAVAEGVTGAEDEDKAVAAATAIVRARLGWNGDSEARAAVLSAFAPVARALFRSAADTDDGESKVDASCDPAQALAEFESWYAANHPTSFWVLFENPMPETPVVDF